MKKHIPLHTEPVILSGGPIYKEQTLTQLWARYKTLQMLARRTKAQADKLHVHTLLK